MKKLFIYLSVALFAMAAVSCQKEFGVAEDGNGNVTFSIHTPDVNTRAIADGENVNIVYYEIYKNEKNHKNSVNGGYPLIDGVIKNFTSGAVLSLNLLQDQNYIALFWAEVDGKKYYDVTDLRDVKVDYNGVYANDESRAAFCQKLEFSTSKSYSDKVELVRPFAQINLGTTLSSIDKNVIGYDLELKQSYMEVDGVGTNFNVASMTTGSGSTSVKFANYTVPHAFSPKEILEVNGVNYAYVGMNYILVPGDASNVDIEYKILTDIGTVTRNAVSAPVKKNHRTNLLGNLLTQETKIEIVVDKKFTTPDENITVSNTTGQNAAPSL